MRGSAGRSRAIRDAVLSVLATGVTNAAAIGAAARAAMREGDPFRDQLILWFDDDPRPRDEQVELRVTVLLLARDRFRTCWDTAPASPPLSALRLYAQRVSASDVLAGERAAKPPTLAGSRGTAGPWPGPGPRIR